MARLPARWLCAAAVVLLGASMSATAGRGQGEVRKGSGHAGPPQAGPFNVRIERSVMIPARDGVALATDLYFPMDANGPDGANTRQPAILIQTPYNKNNWRPGTAAAGSFFKGASFFASHGYVVAVQDVRGKFESQGTFMVAGPGGRDGSDVVSWLATQPWSNGRVGSYGCSYLGQSQVYLLQQNNPRLHSAIVQGAGGAMGSAGGRYRYLGVRIGGALEYSAAVGWFYQNAGKVYLRAPTDLPREDYLKVADFLSSAPKLPAPDFPKLWRHLPLLTLIEESDAPASDWRDIIGRGLTDPWWQQFDYVSSSSRSSAPTLFVDSWYDYGVAETLNMFNQFQKSAFNDTAANNQFAIISPMTHCASENATPETVVGARPLGDATLGYYEIYLRWFDHWLKQRDSGVLRMPKVQYYLMGKNEWRSAHSWPVEQTQWRKYFLRSDGRANSRSGDGLLSTVAPGAETPDRYVYDPASPVPSVGGPACCTGTVDAAPGSYDQREVEMRHDVLVYTSDALQKGVEVTGPIKAVLYVSSSARDTDFTVKLVDVYPDGTAYNVQEGILRARYRDGFERTVFMTPNEIYRVPVDLHATSNYFGPGHRIRVEVSSSSFPRFDRNLNTGGDNVSEVRWERARNVIHHSGEHASHILLPVIPE